MFKLINSISGGISPSFGNKAKTVLAAAVAATALGASVNAFGSIADVTAIETQYTAGTATSVTTTGGGSSGTGFLTTNTYTVNYAGGDLAVTQITAGGKTYDAVSTGEAVVRRDSVNPNVDNLWYATSGNIKTANHSTLNLDGPQEAGYDAALSSNNILVGADNIFGNVGNTANNDTDVERVDMLYTNGVAVSSSNIFTVFDRGQIDQHDGFKIAAITALTNGVPSNYGPLITVSQGTWGNTALIAEQGYTILHTNNLTGGGTYHPSDDTVQTIGGVAIAATDLGVTPGSTIYGYSLFATDTTGSGAELVNWNNSTYFPTNTSAITTGGLDPLAVSATLYSSVPEPTTGVMLVGAIGSMALRRRRSAAV